MKVHMSLAVALATVGGLAASSQAALVYRNTFANGTGTPTVTPGGGTIVAVNGTTTSASIASTGGIEGDGVLTTTNSYGNPNAGVGTTAGAGGSAITNLPAQDGVNVGTVNQFTVTFWIKPTGTGNAAGQFGRLFVLGAAGTTDLANNSFGLEFRGGQVDVRANNQGTGTSDQKGAVLANNSWNFVAITYDGTSASAFNSPTQNAATGFASAANAQLYEGTDTTAVTRYAVNTALSTDGVTNTGAIALGANATLLAMNRSSDFQRGTSGQFDDFRLYDSVLTPAQVEAIRTSVLPATAPEPTTLAAVAGGAIALLRRRRRSL